MSDQGTSPTTAPNRASQSERDGLFAYCIAANGFTVAEGVIPVTTVQ